MTATGTDTTGILITVRCIILHTTVLTSLQEMSIMARGTTAHHTGMRAEELFQPEASLLWEILQAALQEGQPIREAMLQQ